MRRTWTAAQLAALRRDYPACADPAALARRLGKTLTGLRSKAKVLGVVRREPWTDREVALLRAHYGRLTARVIGMHLGGRPAGQVHQMAARLGLTFRPHAVVDDAFRATVRARNAEGWPDTDIAKELGCDRHAVSRCRKALGLPSREKGEVWHARVTAAARRQCAAAGVENLGQLRSKVHRGRARAAGWPEDLRPRAVQILDLLWERGPLTRREIAAALGMPWKGSRHSLTSNDPEGSYLAHLQKRGLVVRFRKAVQVTVQGRGRSLDLYSLSLCAQKGECR